MTHGQLLPGFFTWGYIDGRTQLVFVPCLQVEVPAHVFVIEPSSEIRFVAGGVTVSHGPTA